MNFTNVTEANVLIYDSTMATTLSILVIVYFIICCCAIWCYNCYKDNRNQVYCIDHSDNNSKVSNV